MNKYCMIEIAFGNIEEVNKVIDILLSKKLVASTHYRFKIDMSQVY